MKITNERLSALVGFVYQGIRQLDDESRVSALGINLWTLSNML